jgi:hypothetical protein
MLTPGVEAIIAWMSNGSGLMRYWNIRAMATDNDDERVPTVIYIVTFAYFSSALSICTLLPYLAFMVVSLGLVENVDDAGFYSGLILSAHQAARVLTSYSWGRAADTIGRKPCMIFGSCLTLVSYTIYPIHTDQCQQLITFRKSLYLPSPPFSF